MPSGIRPSVPRSVIAPFSQRTRCETGEASAHVPTICPPLLIPAALQALPPNVGRDVIEPLAQRTACIEDAEYRLSPTTWPASLMSFARLPKSPGITPRSVIAPPCQRKACHTL